jgi:hypothetical protein
MRASNEEIVTHDTDALLLRYAPKSQDADVCISKMQDRINQLLAGKDDWRAQCSFARKDRDAWRETARQFQRPWVLWQGEYDKLLKIIEDAEHAVNCASLRTRVEAPDSSDPRVVFCECNCFKSKVAE